MRALLVSGPAERVVLSGRFAQPAVSLASVDWSREVALVVDMGEQRTAGYRVAVREARAPAPDRIELVLDVERPAPGGVTAQVISHPYALCVVPRQQLGTGPITVIARDASGTELLRQVVQA
jgi:hypothetical protein